MVLALVMAVALVMGLALALALGLVGLHPMFLVSSFPLKSCS